MKMIILCLVLVGVQLTAASWRHEHFVQGLPILDNTQVKSYAGVVPVRNDDATQTEVLFWSVPLLTPRAVYFIGSLKRRSLNRTLRPWSYGFKAGQAHQAASAYFMRFVSNLWLTEWKLLGPYILHDNLTLEHNPYTWTRDFDVVFVDNPVGTGYSYVNPPAQVFPLFVHR